MLAIATTSLTHALILSIWSPQLDRHFPRAGAAEESAFHHSPDQFASTGRDRAAPAAVIGTLKNVLLLSEVPQILNHLRSDGTAFCGQINFRLERVGPRSFDLYESKAGRAAASAVSEILKVSADDEAFQVQFPGVDSDRLPFFADDSKERQHIRQRNNSAKIIKWLERRHKGLNNPFVLWLNRFDLWHCHSAPGAIDARRLSSTGHGGEKRLGVSATVCPGCSCPLPSRASRPAPPGS